ncbi:MAG TPA: polysaccharide biosynthesis/export family protein [Methylovirgula sp.]|nr:polysaccharide biosynthesis/export family protein [Methylovirgula sp.]
MRFAKSQMTAPDCSSPRRRFPARSVFPWIGALLIEIVFGTFSCRAGSPGTYTVEPGDTIQISVVGIPDLHQSATIQTDGTIDFPLAGTIKVEGLSAAELQQQVKERFAGKIYREHATNNGQEILVVIRPEEVSASIVAYRPVYVTGAVLKPGEVTFRPGLTVREALALAGGNDRASSLTSDPMLELLAAKSENQILWLKLSKERAHVASLTSELNNQENIQSFRDPDNPLPPQTLAQIYAQETDVLRAQLANYRRQTDFIQAAVQQDDQQIALLSRQEDEEESGMKSDVDDQKNLAALLRRGVVTKNLVADARRETLISSTRTLQVTAQLLQAKTQKMENEHRLEQLENDRRVSLLKELSEATQDLDATRVNLESSKQKLAFLAQLVPDAFLVADSKPQITLIHHGEGGLARTTVDEDAALEPGDVIDVSLQLPGVAQMAFH